jgi:hypothetical protein
MVKAGIIDPLKVIRTALVDASRYIHMLTVAHKLIHCDKFPCIKFFQATELIGFSFFTFVLFFFFF